VGTDVKTIDGYRESVYSSDAAKTTFDEVGAVYPASHTRTLQTIGYTEREAQFLELAALHSGYFLRRQFNAFLAQARGRAAADFIQKLVDREHVTLDLFLRHVHVYHLSAKPLYTILGQPDNRHRRRRSPFGIKAKLMTLDYVLAHREDWFLATEDARVEYFENLGIEHYRLPQLVYHAHRGGPSTPRYFVEKFPLAVYTDGSIGLTYIDAGEYAVNGFDTFLRRYTPLILALPHVRLTYVADLDRNFVAAAARFESWRSVAGDLGVPRDAAMIDRMLRHFADLERIEANRFEKISVARLREFRAERARFENRECLALYRLWRDEGEDAVREQVAHATGTSAHRRVDFTTYELPHDYSALGAPMYVD